MTIVLTFCLFLLFFVGVGIWSSREKTETTEDYLVASRSVNPWLVALSAVSTNNSGYMFIGLIGFTYQMGLGAVWLTMVWVLGDYLSWLWFHGRLRGYSEEVNAHSVPTLMGTGTTGETSRPITLLAGVATLLFLSLYAAAQLKAGSAATETMFGWPSWVGATVGAVIVVVYCFAGGIRASIWTDAAQSTVMIVAVFLLVAYAMGQVGGPGALVDQLAAIDPALAEWTPKGLALGLGVYLLGCAMNGIGGIGQPHVIIRVMALDSVDSIAKTRNIYIGWFTVFSILALLVGLYARVILPDLGAGLEGAALDTATEKALPILATHLLPEVLVGVILAGLFAATMSTADSQVLACSAAVTQDLFPQYKDSYGASKVATVGVAALALTAALFATSGVFSIVMFAWSGLAAMMGPVLVVRVARLPLPSWLGVAMILTGLSTVIGWTYTPLDASIMKILPGMLAPALLYAVVYQ
ncbi:MAG: sodium/proline symporter, partial [Myxococcota bacterium]|nr:sodium/proline symporter [Myxococcota bacterium]